MIKGSLMLHLGPIWYHSEPSDVPYSQNLPRPISWFGLFLQQNDSNIWYHFFLSAYFLEDNNFTFSYLGLPSPSYNPCITMDGKYFKQFQSEFKKKSSFRTFCCLNFGRKYKFVKKILPRIDEFSNWNCFHGNS